MIRLAPILLLMGCTAAPNIGARDTQPPEWPEGEPGGDDSAPPEESDPPEGWQDTGTVRPDFDYDCDAPIDAPPAEQKILDHARGYHGLAFDKRGELIGWDGRSTLIKADYDGGFTTWVPGVYGVEQIVRHPANGDYYYVSSGDRSVHRLTPEGSSTRLGGSLYSPYGVVVGPDGMLYVSDGNITRVDPETGASSVLLEFPMDQRWLTHAADFSLDSRTLYIGTVGRGELLALPLDEDLEPAGPPEVIATLRGAWMDAVEVDACGWIWVADFNTTSLYRISPEGEVRTILGPEPTLYGHGVVWGNGVGGWRDDAVYMPMPYNQFKVREVVIGVPDGRFVRTWKGQPVDL